MNTPAPRPESAYIDALQSYRSADPISLRLLVDAVEGRARRMRAEAIRDLRGGAARWVCRSIATVASALQPVRGRERLSS
jgi:hypothetical protein